MTTGEIGGDLFVTAAELDGADYDVGLIGMMLVLVACKKTEEGLFCEITGFTAGDLWIRMLRKKIEQCYTNPTT